MNTLQTILSIITTAVALLQRVGAGNSSVQNAEKIAQELLSIATAAANAYQQHTGKPIDLGALQPIDPVA